MDVLLLVHGYNRVTGIGDTVSRIYKHEKYDGIKGEFVLCSQNGEALRLQPYELNKVYHFYSKERPEVGIYYGYTGLTDLNYLMSLIKTAIKHSELSINREISITEEEVRKFYDNLTKANQ